MWFGSKRALCVGLCIWQLFSLARISTNGKHTRNELSATPLEARLDPPHFVLARQQHVSAQGETPRGGLLKSWVGHSQSPRPFERWIDSMNRFWRLSGPLAIQSHYLHPLPRFQTRPHRGCLPYIFPSPLFSKSHSPSNYPMPGWDKELRPSSHQTSAELMITGIPLIPATLVICTQETAADFGVKAWL